MANEQVNPIIRDILDTLWIEPDPDPYDEAQLNEIEERSKAYEEKHD